MSETSGNNLPLLSLCIPTYNKGPYIGDTLESILAQDFDGLEVVIVDGASQDETASVVESYADRFHCLRYFRKDNNSGVDLDMSEAVGLARGHYCWLMSSDDLLAEGAIPKALQVLEQGYDIILCDALLCSKEMQPLRATSYLSKDHPQSVFQLSSRDELFEYFARATSNNALFCYMSTIIFLQEKWQEVPFSEPLTRSGYAHVHRLFSIGLRGGTLKYLNMPLVLNRGGNDNFSANGLDARFMLDFHGYLTIANLLFPADEYLRRAFLNVMTKEHRWYRLAKLRAVVRDTKRWEDIKILLNQFGYSRKVIAISDLLGRLPGLVTLAVILNQKSARYPFNRALRRLFKQNV